MPSGIYLHKKGYKMSEEAKQKMRHPKNWTKEGLKRLSDSKKGKPLSLETKAKLSIVLKGHLVSEETKRKISNSTKGKLKSEESKQKNRDWHLKYSYWKGKKHTEQTKNKISDWHKGKIVSDLTKEKLRDYRLGKSYNELYTYEIANKLKKEHSVRMQNINNPNWRNGSSFVPYSYDFNKKFKKYIKNRDKFCMICNISIEDLKILERPTYVHHIDYDKNNSFKENCVLLCSVCHGKTNFNREQWILFFQSLLKERYNYKYTQDQKIILDFISDNQ